ncbi:hypothetical protein [Thiocystis violascens]|nr:hypothetical protein [Thiocystis violascens]
MKYVEGRLGDGEAFVIAYPYSMATEGDAGQFNGVAGFVSGIIASSSNTSI